MPSGTKQFITGAGLLILSIFFLPQGIADFAVSAARNEPTPSNAALLVTIGSILALGGVVVLIWAAVLRHRSRNTVRTHDTREPEKSTDSRPGYGMQGRPAWMDRPVNHMGKNSEDRRK